MWVMRVRAGQSTTTGQHFVFLKSMDLREDGTIKINFIISLFWQFKWIRMEVTAQEKKQSTIKDKKSK